MASPTVLARTESGSGTQSTTLTVNFTQTTGNLVVIFIALDDTGQNISFSEGFTLLSNNGPTLPFQAWYKELDGSEGGNAVATVSSATRFAAIAYNISGHSAGTAPEINTGTGATGTSTTPDPPSITPPSSKDYLFIASFRQNGEEADDDTWCNSAPTNYTNLVQKSSGTTGATTTNGAVAAAERALTTGSPENPGTFSIDQSLAWRAFTILIHPAVANPVYRNPMFQLLPH